MTSPGLGIPLAGVFTLLVLSDWAFATCPSASTPVAAPSPQCDNAACGCLTTIDPSCHPTGKILDGFVVRGACDTFGAPLSRVRPRLAFGGTFQSFENGEIANYPTFPGGAGTADFVISAYTFLQSDPQNPTVLLPAIQADWNSTAPFSYDQFILRFDLEDHAENVAKQHDPAEGDDPQQLDLEVSGSSGTARFWAPKKGIYAIYVEGCDDGFLGADCDKGWSYPVYVDRLDRIVGAVPQPATSPAQFTIPQGILDVPDYSKVPYDQEIPIVGRLCNSGTLRVEAKEDDHYEELNGDATLARLEAARLLDALQVSPLNSFLVSELNAGPACAGKPSAQLRQEVNDAVLASKVNSRPGTDVAALIRTATAAALGVSIAAILTMAFSVLFSSLLPGAGLKAIAVALGLTAGGLAGILLAKSDPGDYDMRLVDYIRIFHHFGNDLSVTARDHIVDELLTTKGGEDERKDFLWISGLPTPAPETENHIWMTESSRYLTNNILFDRTKDSEYDNDQNGMTDWVLDELRKLLAEDFYELNSRPYAPYAYGAIQNLSDFAGIGAGNCSQIVDPGAPPQSRRCDVRRAARSVLDYLNARFALSSNGLRRAVPFRRQPPFRDYPRLLTNGGDDMSWLVFAYTGGSDFVRDQRNSHLMEFADGMIMNAVLSRYRPPLILTDLIRSPGFPSALGVQRFRSRARGANTAEVYYRGASFTISAGGRYDSGSGFLPDNFTEGEDAWALPTTLMPDREGEDMRDLVRIAGSTDVKERNNLCVGPRFACGMNPTLPAGLPAGCKEVIGNWTFIDFTLDTPTCPFGYGYYVAFYRKDCTTDDCENAAGDPEPGSFGFFEATPWRTFDLYKEQVLQLNSQLTYEFGQFNVYRSPTGIDIAFVADASVLRGLGVKGDSSAITGISNRVTGTSVPFERDLGKWPIGQGPLLNSPRQACIFVDNLKLRQRLIIDNTNAMKPRRSIIPTTMTERCGCPLTDICLSPRAE